MFIGLHGLIPCPPSVPLEWLKGFGNGCGMTGKRLRLPSRQPAMQLHVSVNRVMRPQTGRLQRSTSEGAEREFGDPLCGWQQLARKAGDERALEMHLSHLDAASRALRLSQAGPHAARILTVFPVTRTREPQPGADVHPGRASDGAAIMQLQFSNGPAVAWSCAAVHMIMSKFFLNLPCHVLQC